MTIEYSKRIIFCGRPPKSHPSYSGQHGPWRSKDQRSQIERWSSRSSVSAWRTASRHSSRIRLARL